MGAVRVDKDQVRRECDSLIGDFERGRKNYRSAALAADSPQ